MIAVDLFMSAAPAPLAIALLGALALAAMWEPRAPRPEQTVASASEQHADAK